MTIDEDAPVDWEDFFFLPRLTAEPLTEEQARMLDGPPALVIATLNELHRGPALPEPSARWLGDVQEPGAIEEFERYAATLGFRGERTSGSSTLQWKRDGELVATDVVLSVVYHEACRKLNAELEELDQSADQALTDWFDVYDRIDSEQRREREALSAQEYVSADIAVMFAASGELHPRGFVRGPVGSVASEQLRRVGRIALWRHARIGAVPIFGRAMGRGKLVRIEAIELREIERFHEKLGRIKGVNEQFWNDVHFKLADLRGAFPPTDQAGPAFTEAHAVEELRSLMRAGSNSTRALPVGEQVRADWVARGLSGNAAKRAWRAGVQEFPALGSPRGKAKTRRVK